MSWNEFEKNIKETTDTLWDKIFGILKPTKSDDSKIPRKDGWFEGRYRYDQAERIWQEMERKKGRAIQFVRCRLQNC